MDNMHLQTNNKVITDYLFEKVKQSKTRWYAKLQEEEEEENFHSFNAALHVFWVENNSEKEWKVAILIKNSNFDKNFHSLWSEKFNSALILELNFTTQKCVVLR